jgi:hypothetical protein
LRLGFRIFSNFFPKKIQNPALCDCGLNESDLIGLGWIGLDLMLHTWVQVALVSQEPVLFARSIRRNIIFGLEAEDGLTGVCACVF